MSGHSKWANIKHHKAKQDARRSKVWSKCARAIIVAAKAGGGDPAANLSLRYAIDDAKAENMPKDTIEKAIQKGTGELGGVNYESTVYEGYGPSGVAILMDILTDNRNRTAGELRRIFDRHGGNMSGSVAYLFEAKGQVILPKQAGDEDDVTAAVLDAGAEDVADLGDFWQVLCNPADFMAVKGAIEAAGLPTQSAGITKVPTMTVTCTGADARKVLGLVDALEDHDDVQKVYANFEIPDDELAAIEQA